MQFRSSAGHGFHTSLSEAVRYVRNAVGTLLCKIANQITKGVGGNVQDFKFLLEVQRSATVSDADVTMTTREWLGNPILRLAQGPVKIFQRYFESKSDPARERNTRE